MLSVIEQCMLFLKLGTVHSTAPALSQRLNDEGHLIAFLYLDFVLLCGTPAAAGV